MFHFLTASWKYTSSLSSFVICTGCITTFLLLSSKLSGIYIQWAQLNVSLHVTFRSTGCRGMLISRGSRTKFELQSIKTHFLVDLFSLNSCIWVWIGVWDLSPTFKKFSGSTTNPENFNQMFLILLNLPPHYWVSGSYFSKVPSNSYLKTVYTIVHPSFKFLGKGKTVMIVWRAGLRMWICLKKTS